MTVQRDLVDWFWTGAILGAMAGFLFALILFALMFGGRK